MNSGIFKLMTFFNLFSKLSFLESIWAFLGNYGNFLSFKKIVLVKFFLSIAEILAIELFVPTYPIFLGKLGLRFFLQHEPPRPPKIFFSAVFFSKIFPRPEATLAMFLWIFAFFQLCPTWVFLKKCPNLPNFTLHYSKKGPKFLTPATLRGGCQKFDPLCFLSIIILKMNLS